jgi:hypothetical protein
MKYLAGFVVPVLIGVGCATGGNPIPPEDDGGTTPTDSGGPCTSKCDGGCADLKTDSLNCGACGKKCGTGATCVQGSCQCAMGQSVCAGACVDLKTDVSNCGKCGTACGGDGGTIMGGGTWGCANGTCSIMCPMLDGGLGMECGGACVDLTKDNDNCGSCGNACAQGTEQCTQGLCCKLGQTVCNGGADGGGPQCTDTKSDANNCGSCGKVCSGNTPACASGTCVACGTDCWSASGCLTQGGHCVRFACRAGSAGATFCNQCMGWTEITYNDWMNGGYCLDVHKAYNAANGVLAMCGGSPTCCGTKANCGSGNVAWHFSDGVNNHYTGPSLQSLPQNANCAAYNGTDNSAYTRLTACKKY